MITDKKAEELEQRGLWRRAAARWQELLLNYLQEDDRICIQRRIQHCLKRAKMKSQRATSQEEFSFRLLRSSAIQTEKEMGIYRDRKTAHDHLYRQDGKNLRTEFQPSRCNRRTAPGLPGIVSLLLP
uniref:PerC family transcriptional regulator n=1 Tax=Escherichia coli TaxID=562 RepID=UPI002882F2AB|nr:PerC family transcriptional regulator [Escherichia coli]WNI98378.1 PerC family transcriptional regulator [Escherichia coli]